jgi:hypothetical protein
METGSVTFFDGPLIAGILNNNRADPRLPPELREHDPFRPEDLAGDVVAARVQLDDHLIDTAVETARTMTLALVWYASLYSRWVGSFGRDISPSWTAAEARALSGDRPGPGIHRR